MNETAPARPELYRLEHTLVSERLVPVARPEEATHAGIALLRRMADAHAREQAKRQAEADRLARRVRDLEAWLAQLTQRAEQAEAQATAHAQQAAQATASMRRLAAKVTELIGEKRRLRDALIGTHPLPAIHYRVDIDREDQAHETVIETLDAFPDKEHVREALADAWQRAERCGGRLRAVRLDSPAWRAVIQRMIAR